MNKVLSKEELIFAAQNYLNYEPTGKGNIVRLVGDMQRRDPLLAGYFAIYLAEYINQKEVDHDTTVD